MSDPQRPRIALTLGDPAGIGPEVALSVLADPRVAEVARLVAVGPESCRPAGLEGDHEWIDCGDDGGWTPGRPQAASGRAALRALRIGADLALAGEVEALVTAPVSKESLHLAGEPVEGQTTLLARWAGVEQQVEMLAVAERLRVLLLTRHLPLREALEAITIERVVDRLILLDAGLRTLGVDDPRLALAGLNPHAGEHGLIGVEEDEILRPALSLAHDRGLDVRGPESPDTVFLRGFRGDFDGVLALYHDQAFLPVKIVAPGTGLTVLLGMPYLRVSPAHGTAFDLVGTGRADPGNLALAVLQAARWAQFAALSRA